MLLPLRILFVVLSGVRCDNGGVRGAYPLKCFDNSEKKFLPNARVRREVGNTRRFANR